MAARLKERSAIVTFLHSLGSESHNNRFKDIHSDQKQFGLLQFVLKVNGIKLSIMIDSGASKDFIDASVAKRAGFTHKLLENPYPVSLADGTQINCAYKNPNCQISFGRGKNNHPF